MKSILLLLLFFVWYYKPAGEIWGHVCAGVLISYAIISFVATAFAIVLKYIKERK